MTQPEIHAYWERIFAKHALANHTSFHTEVVSARWDEAAQVYDITLEDTRTKEQRTVRANVLWWAAGGFHAPFFPEDVPGVREFKGDVWHSARWNHGVDLRGKRVGVIGNGCSGSVTTMSLLCVKSESGYIERSSYLGSRRIHRWK